MHIVSVINYKGGVGKTSLTVNLAAELAFCGKKILLVDLDAQASLTFSLISPDQWREHYEATKTTKALAKYWKCKNQRKQAMSGRFA